MPRKTRSFVMSRTLANSRNFSHAGVIAFVTAFTGKNMQTEVVPTIDQRTGVISLPDFANGWKEVAKIENTDKASFARNNLRDRLVTNFALEIAHHKDNDRVIIAQRENGDRYRLAANVAPYGDLVVHSEPPCEVRSRIVSDNKEMAEQNIPRVVLWVDTQMQSRCGSNRADIIAVSKTGRVTLDRVLIIYLDGEFRLVQDIGWRGYVYKRTAKTPYTLKSEDKRVAAAFGSDEVRKILNGFVFVPDVGHPSIEQWLQMLLLPKFRELVRSATLEKWDDDEDFWIRPEPKVALTSDKQAVLDWFVYGTGGSAMGYATLRQPITFKGREITKVQLRHQTTDTGRIDRQGLKLLRPGDILLIHKLVDMDNSGKQWNPLADCSVLYYFREEGEEPLDEAAA
ncbi:MAG TPA: hypothetical protein VMR46_00630 [Candidatus Paceibacterota bacterium]|nr:hypothetical protein [Candidatus Paceibacterota bacterium]